MLDFITHFFLQIRRQFSIRVYPGAVGMNTFLEQGSVVSNYFSLSGIHPRPDVRIELNPMLSQRHSTLCFWAAPFTPAEVSLVKR